MGLPTKSSIFPSSFFQCLLLGTIAAAQTVTIANGTLQGSRCADTAVNSFLKIPYAQPPIGPLRFTAPQPWTTSFVNGTRDATAAAPACVQFLPLFAEAGEQSEDCLFVDVWAPANATADSNLPVKVWLYGGGNAAGGISNPTYSGCTAALSTIQVSINYRVGPLGSISVPSMGFPGNQGIQDQLLGLQWVQDNIGAFGGNRSQVLLFGQSAGALNAVVLSSLPQAPQLMSAAIMQSGAGSNLSTLAAATPQSEAYVGRLNCTTADCAQNASLDIVRAAYNTTEVGYTGPVVDGSVVPVQPVLAGSKVPVMAGSTTQEATLFLLGQFRETATNLTAADYDALLVSLFGSNNDIVSRVNATYPLSRFSNQTLPIFTAMTEVFTVSSFRCPTRQFLSRNKRNSQQVWTYSFNHTPSCAWYPDIPAVSLPILGSTHTAEIPFVFGGTDGLPRPNGTCTFTDAEKALSARMLAAWDAMARDGRPGDETSWPAWDEDESRGWNVVADDVLVGKVDYSMCDFWDEIYEMQALQASGSAGQAGGNGTTTVSWGTRVDVGHLTLSSLLALFVLAVTLI